MAFTLLTGQHIKLITPDTNEVFLQWNFI